MSRRKDRDADEESEGCDPRKTAGPDGKEEGECDESECGGEEQAPDNEHHVCGIDYRPMLPLLLIGSTVLGAVCMLVLILPLADGVLYKPFLVKIGLSALYAIAVLLMLYCALCDPGQVKDAQGRDEASDKLEGAEEDELGLPERAHKTWLYRYPVRRYDHYCKWLANAIGLYNHREFVVMCGCLAVLGTCGSILDAWLMVSRLQQGNYEIPPLELIFHIVYSMGLVAKVGSIFRIHIGLISRNELAYEWTGDDFYVVTNRKTGKDEAVNDLSEDEREERANSFRYDGQRNRFDKGTSANCWAFWCTSRCDPDENGDF